MNGDETPEKDAATLAAEADTPVPPEEQYVPSWGSPGMGIAVVVGIIVAVLALVVSLANYHEAKDDRRVRDCLERIDHGNAGNVYLYGYVLDECGDSQEVRDAVMERMEWLDSDASHTQELLQAERTDNIDNMKFLCRGRYGTNSLCARYR